MSVIKCNTQHYFSSIQKINNFRGFTYDQDSVGNVEPPSRSFLYHQGLSHQPEMISMVNLLMILNSKKDLLLIYLVNFVSAINTSTTILLYTNNNIG